MRNVGGCTRYWWEIATAGWRPEESEAGEQGWGLGENTEGLTSTDWKLQHSRRDIKHVGNVVNNVAAPRHGAGWVLAISRGPLCKAL